jgi:hypothetical protein
LYGVDTGASRLEKILIGAGPAMPMFSYVGGPNRFAFTGKVVRIEADGFGIVKFDQPIGPTSNDYGIVTSSSTSTSPLAALGPGVQVEGTAEADERNVASIKTFQITSRSD